MTESVAVVASYNALKILLVEDNQHMRTIVRQILKGTGINDVREAHDGMEAFEILRQYAADIVLIDYNMTPMDGIEFTRMLRTASDSPNPYLPVIMITGHSETLRVVQARDAGINEFVVKPLNATSLLARLQSVIMHPRPFIRCASYLGPDRRRKPRADYHGPFRRASDGAT